jgi:hypothetical protein
MLEQRERRQIEGRIAEQTKQCAVQQRGLPGRAGRSADEDHRTHHIKQIEQDRRREPDLAQHVANLGDEKALCENPQKQEVQRHEDG